MDNEIPTPIFDEAWEDFVKSGHTNHDILSSLCCTLERELAAALAQNAVLVEQLEIKQKVIEQLGYSVYQKSGIDPI